jgi:hypothetical protein
MPVYSESEVTHTIYESSSELCSMSTELSWRVPDRRCEVPPTVSSNKRLCKEASAQMRGRANMLLSQLALSTFDSVVCCMGIPFQEWAE